MSAKASSKTPKLRSETFLSLHDLFLPDTVSFPVTTERVWVKGTNKEKSYLRAKPMSLDMELYLYWAWAVGRRRGAIAAKLHCDPQTVTGRLKWAKKDMTRFIECGFIMRREDWGTVSWVCRYCLSVFPGDYSSVAVLDAWRHVFDPAAKFDSRSMLERAQ